MNTDNMSTAPYGSESGPPLHHHAEKPSWDANRVRVARACDRCKKRKVRCSGTQPCEGCIRVDAHCVYNAQYNRGRHPRIPPHSSRISSSQTQMMVSQASSPPMASTAAYEQPADSTRAGHQDPSRPPGRLPVPAQALTTEPPSRASPEPTQTDLQGHYVGPASGVSFLLRVQNRLHHTSSSFTFGDAPLPEFDPTFCVMISKEETQVLLQRYFDFTVPVDRFLHRPTIEAWLKEFHDTMGAMNPSENAPAQRALLWTMFAMAQDTLSPMPGVAVMNKSVRHFLSAEYQLSKDRGAVNIVSVQARLCQCLWLLSQSRINHCWTLFGIAARLALAIGLNRSRQSDITAGFTPIEIECRRRTFWNAYCLDNYLSVALGRPRIFHDEDIDQELPSCLDDNDIYVDRLNPRVGQGLSLMFAPVAYFKLSRIISMILRDIYSIRSPSTADRCKFAAKYSESLKSWRADISHFVDVENINTAMLIPIFHRQRNVLNLAYWHTMILTHRPFLLGSFARLQQSGRSSRENVHKSQIEESIKECLNAAMSIVDTVNGLIQDGMMFQAFWFTSYFAFSAVVVLYVYIIQRASSLEDSYQGYLAAAIRCQNQIFNIAEKGSLAARYCLVLEELRAEATKQTESSRNLPPGEYDVEVTGLGHGRTETAQTLNGNPNIEGAVDLANIPGSGNEFDFSNSPRSSLADFTSWLQFESMAAPGFGGYGGYEMSFTNG